MFSRFSRQFYLKFSGDPQGPSEGCWGPLKISEKKMQSKDCLKTPVLYKYTFIFYLIKYNLYTYLYMSIIFFNSNNDKTTMI